MKPSQERNLTWLIAIIFICITTMFATYILQNILALLVGLFFVTAVTPYCYIDPERENRNNNLSTDDKEENDDSQRR